MTLPLTLYSMQESMMMVQDWVGIFTTIVIIIIPTIILYVLLSEKLIGGITMGALK